LPPWRSTALPRRHRRDGLRAGATQAFVYNAVIFTFSLALTGLFEVDSSVAGLYLIPFGIANFLGARACSTPSAGA